MQRKTTDNRATLKHAVRWAVAFTAIALTRAAAADGPLAANVPVAGVSFTPAVPPVVGLVESGTDNSGRLSLTINKTAVLTTKDKYKRFSIGNPEIADVTAVGPTTLLVTGKKAGSTQVIVWNDQEQSQVIDIAVEVDVQAMRDEFKKTFPDAAITVDVINGQVTLKGRVPNLKMAEQAARVAGAYSKDVINFLEVGGGQQIVLGVQFIEMARSASVQLGFNSFFTDGHTRIGFDNAPGGNPIGAFATGAAEATIPSSATVFAAGTIGKTAFETFIQALKQNNLARTLAEPNLVAISGEDANFLAGGEIPIPVPQAGAGGSSTITIEYKEFGVRLKYNAVVLGDGRIRLKVEPEVSSLDYNNGTTIQGSAVPGLTTRKVSSIVEMSEGQTLALAGLLQRSVNAKSAGTPGLSDLPIVGAFFRNVQYTRTETELVILVTPRLAQAMNPGQVPPTPGANWRYPNEWQLFGLGDLGGPVDNKKTGPTTVPTELPRYVGPNGFDEQGVQSPVAQVDSK